MPSLVAEIGDVLESHLRMIGLLKDNPLDAHQKKLIAKKRAEYERSQPLRGPSAADEFPGGAELCAKRHSKAMVQMDGCLTCLNCGESKCG